MESEASTRRSPGSGARTRRRPAAARAGAAALAALCLAACLQTESGDGAPPQPDLPGDKGRRAGATSSTNWPAEFGTHRYAAAWSADTALRIRFFDVVINPAPAREVPVARGGVVSLYPGDAVPVWDSLRSVSWSFTGRDTLVVPFDSIPVPPGTAEDTIAFNVRLSLDSLHGMVYGLRYSRRSRSILIPPVSGIPEKTIYLDSLKHYFRGATAEVTSLLPPTADGDPRISFYIPGTPSHCWAQPDSFHLGPLPKGNYPLRVLRISGTGTSGAAVTVQAWELLVSGLGNSSQFSLGEQVLSFRSQGPLDLEEGE